MLSISPVSGADYYLRDGHGCGTGKSGAGGAVGYELDAIAAGEPPGEWYFPYRNDLGVEGEIVPDAASGEAFRKVLNELRHPLTDEPLGKAAPNYASVDERVEKFKRRNPLATVEQIAEAKTKAEQDHRVGRNGWDLTFSVTKSISILHAAFQREGRHDEAGEVIASFRSGIDAAMRIVADQMTYTRRGVSGPKVNGRTTTRYVRNADIQTAIFRHHVSRDRDPQLHAHVMLLNRILCEDGQWRAVDTVELLKSKHGLDAVFQRVMEAEITERLGVRFAARPDGMAREVVGIDEALRDLFSSRTRALTERAQEYIDAWELQNGQAAPALVKWRLQQRANRDTRKAKLTDAPDREAELARWDQEMAAEFRQGLAEATEAVDEAARQPASPHEFEPDAVIELALADLSKRKASWKRSHLTHAINKHLPEMLQVDPAQVPVLLAELTEAALAGRQVVSLSAPAAVPVPESLKDSVSGESVFEPPTGGHFTTKTHLGREDSLISRLEHRGAPVLTAETAARVLGDRGLSDEQLEVATAILTSDRAIEVVDAGAGTGKSRLMAALSETSAEVWGHGLVGLTTAQNAAQVLAREGVSRAHNISAFLDYRARERRGEVSDLERATFAVPRGATVVVDEASMVSTPDMTALLAELDRVQVGRVVMIGDTAQVDAVDAGGGFRLLTQEREPLTLTQVRRFDHDWERDASARLRGGDLSALAQYEAQNRIQGGDPEQVEREAVQAFVTDHLDGDDTVLVVSTADHGAKLSSEIRQRLVEFGRVDADGVPLLRDTTAGVGDLVQTRLNRSDLGVVNREVWRVTAANRDTGELEVQRADQDEQGNRVWGPVKTLPARYVAAHVDLAYATTVEAVQGRTTDTAHLLLDDMMGLSRAYPGLTRGRRSNTAWVPVTPPARRFRESDAEYEARIPSPMSAMVAAFEKEDHAEAARTVIRAEQERATNLGHLGPQWASLVAEHRAVDHREVLGEVAGTDRHALFMDMSLDGLLHLMRSAESHGYDVRAELEAVLEGVRLEGSRSPASVLYARLDQHLKRDNVQPRDEVERAASYAERTPVGDDERIDYARQVAEVMDSRVVELGEHAVVEPPEWATALLGAVPADPVDRADWTQKVAVIAGYREQYGWDRVADPVGPAPSRAEPEKRWAWTRAAEAAGENERRRDMAEQPDAELANRVLEWRRCEEWMPRNVDEELREAHQAHGEIRRVVVEGKARGEDTDADEVDRTEMAARVARFEKVADARRWSVEHTAKTRDAAQEAVAEITRRSDRDLAAADREAARHAADDRDAREAADRDARVHEAVGERFRAQYVRDAPVFGSPRWAELDDEDAAKRSGLFTAALQWWRSGAPRDEADIDRRLDGHADDGARQLDGLVRFDEPQPVAERFKDKAPDQRAHVVAWEREAPDRDGALSGRAREQVRAGMDEDEARALDTTTDPDVLAKVHRYTEPDLRGDAPEFGSPDYADADDERKGKAETRAALRWHRGGDDLDERAQRADEADDKASAVDISRDIQDRTRHPFDNRTHAQVVDAREKMLGREREEKAPEPKVEKPAREEPKPEPAAREEPPARVPEPAVVKPPEPERDEPKPEPSRPDTSWTRAAERASREPAPDPAPERDDLSVQVDRAKAAVERMQREDAQRQVPVRHEPVRAHEAPER